MLGKHSKLGMITVAGLVVGMNAAMAANLTPAGDTINVSDSTGGETVVGIRDDGGSETYMYSKDGSTGAGWNNVAITINDGKHLIIGPGKPEDTFTPGKFDVSVKSLKMIGSGSTGAQLTLKQSQDGVGSIFRVGTLDATGTITIEASQDTSEYSQNRLFVDTFNAAGLMIGVGQKSLFQVNNSSTLTGTKLTVAENAEAIFKGKVTLSGGNDLATRGGALRFESDVSMASGDTITLASGGIADFSALKKPVNLGSGAIVAKSSLTRTGSDDNKIVSSDGFIASSAGSIQVESGATMLFVTDETDTEATGNLIIASKNALVLNGKLGVNDLTIESGTNGNLFQSANNGTLDMNTLTVKSGAIVNGDASVTTTVRQDARIDGNYNLAGNNNIFGSSIYVSGTGTLGAASNATMTMGSDGSTGNITVANGGTLGSRGKTLTIATDQGVQNTLAFTGTNSVNSVRGTITAQNSRLVVSNDLLVDGGLTGFSYNQSAGNVTGAGATSRITALSKAAVARISGNGSTFGANGVFHGGLNVLGGAALVGNRNTINAGGNDKALLTVDAASRIDLSNNGMTISDFNTVRLDGKLVLGVTDGEINALSLDDGVNLAANLDDAVTFSNSFLQYYQDRNRDMAGGEIIDLTKGGTINGETTGSWTSSSVFGDFTFAYDKSGLYLSQYKHSDINDLANIRRRLGDTYGEARLNDAITTRVSGVANNMMNAATGLVSDGSHAGDMNYGIFESLAKGMDTWSYTRDGKTYSGAMGKGMLATMNGSTAAAPIYVAQDTIRDLQNTLTSRLEAYRAVKDYVVVASNSALGMADFLNERYLNRVWAGSLGNWQNANARKGHDGWKYKAAGGIVGYDRAFGAAIVGTSFAFVDGNYTDKTFDWNDSKIRQHNVNLYGTYSASNGFYFTGMGGYNYSRNKLRYGFDGAAADELYRTNTWYASGKFGYDVMPCDNVSITPSIGVNYFYSRSSSHDIRMNDQALTSLGRMKEHHLEMPIDLQVSYEAPIGEYGSLTFMANGGYTYNFSDRGVRGDVFSGLGLTSLDGGALPYSGATGRKLGHHAWKAGAGVKFSYDRWDVGVKYDYYGRNEYNAHRLTGAIGYNF